MKKAFLRARERKPRVRRAPNDGMMVEEPRMQTLQIVRTEGQAKVDDLVRRFNPSAVTIRSDLNELDQRGVI